jgi:hypothetical protein
MPERTLHSVFIIRTKTGGMQQISRNLRRRFKEFGLIKLFRKVFKKDDSRHYIFCSLQAFVHLEKMRSKKLISNWYELQRNLFTKVIREYILANLGST